MRLSSLTFERKVICLLDVPVSIFYFLGQFELAGSEPGSEKETRSSAQDNCSAKSLALPYIAYVHTGRGVQAGGSRQGVQAEGGPGRGGGSRPGGPGRGGGLQARGGPGRGARGHFIHLAIYCTTTWCLPQRDFAQQICIHFTGTERRRIAAANQRSPAGCAARPTQPRISLSSFCAAKHEEQAHDSARCVNQSHRAFTSSKHISLHILCRRERCLLHNHAHISEFKQRRLEPKLRTPH